MECHYRGSRIESPILQRNRQQQKTSGWHTRAGGAARTHNLIRTTYDANPERHRLRNAIGSMPLASPIPLLHQATLDMFRGVYIYSSLEDERRGRVHMPSTRLLIQSLFSHSPQPERVELDRFSLVLTTAGNERQLPRQSEKITRSLMRNITWPHQVTARCSISYMLSDSGADREFFRPVESLNLIIRTQKRL